MLWYFMLVICQTNYKHLYILNLKPLNLWNSFKGIRTSWIKSSTNRRKKYTIELLQDLFFDILQKTIFVEILVQTPKHNSHHIQCTHSQAQQIINNTIAYVVKAFCSRPTIKFN